MRQTARTCQRSKPELSAAPSWVLGTPSSPGPVPRVLLQQAGRLGAGETVVLRAQVQSELPVLPRKSPWNGSARQRPPDPKMHRMPTPGLGGHPPPTATGVAVAGVTRSRGARGGRMSLGTRYPLARLSALLLACRHGSPPSPLSAPGAACRGLGCTHLYGVEGAEARSV